MPLRLEIKKIFSQRSDRVKCVELHPTEPWILASLYNGHVYIWNYAEQSLVKSFEATDLPVRAARFVPRKQWVVCGADDMQVRVYNYNTMDKVKQFEAHSDYIRHIAVHPTLPYCLTCSDDMLIKLWDWDKGWACTQVFEGHSHYVMQLVFNPKDTNTFASASLDRTIKVWSLGQPTANMTLEGHEKGVNCIDYYSGGDRPYLVSGADDRLVKVWDYQTKACIQTLDGHSHNVSTVAFHPELPLIMTGGEDGTVKLWHSTTYRLENTFNYGMERVWAVGCVKGTNSIAIGYDEGCVMVKLGREEPVASMDASGKIIWARHNEVQTVNVKSLGDAEETDGERLPLAVKDLGSSDLYPQSLQHSPNGRFVTVCGDGEYVIYTALAWRNKSFGAALEFVWGDDSNVFATRESSSTIKIHRGFKEALTIKTAFAAEAIYGGQLLGVRAQDFVVFYDWNTGRVVRRIDVAAKAVYWSESGGLVVIASDASFYLLQYNADVAEEVLGSGQEVDEDGVEEAFELQAELPEVVRTGIWVGDCFVYNNAAWRLNYCVGGEITTLYHLDRPMYLLGYLASQSKVYLMDKDFSVLPYSLLLSVVEYKTLVLRGDMETAAEVLATIPEDQHNSIAKFLEAKGMPEVALEVATDADYRFELAVSLGMLDLALELAGQSDNESKWRQLGELALANAQLDVAAQCFTRAKDLGGLLLLHSSHADAAGMQALADMAEEGGRQNIAFVAHFLLGHLDRCIDLLLACGRLPEAAFFARTYAPSRMTEVVQQWQADLAKINPKAAESLANPQEYPNLFPGIQDALQAEAYLRAKAATPVPAARYPELEGEHMQADILSRIAELSLNGLPPAAAAAAAALAAAPAVNGGDPVGDLLGMDEEADEDEDEGEEEFADASSPPQQHAAAAAAAAVVDEEAEEEEDLDAVLEAELLAEPPAAAPPAAAAGSSSGLTPEEEALLAEDDDDLLGGGGDDDADLAVDDADLADDLDDDWGIDGEAAEEEEKAD